MPQKWRSCIHPERLTIGDTNGNAPVGPIASAESQRMSGVVLPHASSIEAPSAPKELFKRVEISTRNPSVTSDEVNRR